MWINQGEDQHQQVITFCILHLPKAIVLWSQLLTVAGEMSNGLRKSMENKASERAMEEQMTQEQTWRWRKGGRVLKAGVENFLVKRIRTLCPFELQILHWQASLRSCSFFPLPLAFIIFNLDFGDSQLHWLLLPVAS